MMASHSKTPHRAKDNACVRETLKPNHHHGVFLILTASVKALDSTDIIIACIFYCHFSKIIYVFFVHSHINKILYAYMCTHY